MSDLTATLSVSQEPDVAFDPEKQALRLENFLLKQELAATHGRIQELGQGFLWLLDLKCNS